MNLRVTFEHALKVLTGIDTNGVYLRNSMNVLSKRT